MPSSLRSIMAAMIQLGSACLVAFAVAGLVVPAEVVAQTRAANSLTGLSADSRLEITVHALNDDGQLPSHFSVRGDDGRQFEFRWAKGGYAWTVLDDPTLGGFRAIPDLGEALAWEIEHDGQGAFDARLPLEAFGVEGSVQDHFKAGAGGNEVQVFGLFEAQKNLASLSALAADGSLVDLTIDFSPLGTDLATAANWQSVTEADKGFIIVIPFATLLILLGVAILACFGFGSACMNGCQLTCPNGVQRVVSAFCGISCTCECFPPVIEHPCRSTGNAIGTLSLDGADPLLLPKTATTTLDRLEQTDEVHHGEEVSFLMGEWALLAVDGGSDEVAVLRTSSYAFAEGKARTLGAVLKARPTAARGTTLVVEYPAHEANSRRIEMPELRLVDDRPLDLADGRLLVRADFQKRSLAELEVIQDTVGGLAAEQLAQLESQLQLEFASDKDHRVVVFAVLAVDGGRLELVDTLQYLPKCCCGVTFCV